MKGSDMSGEIRFGLLLQQARTRRNLTQARFAGRLRITINFLSQVENERKFPSIQCFTGMKILLRTMREDDIQDLTNGYIKTAEYFFWDKYGFLKKEIIESSAI